MKFATWNLLSRSKTQVEAVNFLLHEEKVDVVCLQEVRGETIEYLKNSQQSDLYVECSHSYYDRRDQVYSAIISRMKPVVVVSAKFNYILPLSVLSRLSDLDYRDSGYQYNEYSVGEKTVRIFNIHLPFGASPMIRLKILGEVLENLYVENNVICGDFNSFGHFPWNILVNPLNGARWDEYKLHELEELKKLVAKFNLKLSVVRVVTYPSCRTHLDHIVVPESWSAYTCNVLSKRYGSDHNIVVLEEQELIN